MISTSKFKLALAASVMLIASNSIASANIISEWNSRAEEIQAPLDLPAPPLVSTRTLTMMNVAMFEAANSIGGRYAAYHLDLPKVAGASVDAAAASAAFEVLVISYPAHKVALEAALAADLAKISDADARAKGVDIGKKAAAGIMALRANDPILGPESYRPFTRAGTYVPTQIPFYSNVAAGKPWVMASASQFRPGPPPKLNSERYIKDYNEVRELGERNSKKRTAEQTDIGRFWFATGHRTWNPILRQIIAHKKLDVVESARFFSLVNMAANDGYQAVFDAKYTYNFWRPVTAIRNADMLKNKSIPREASWQPLGNTPPHPEYPCAHCIASTGVATVIQALYGDTPVPEVTLVSPTAPGVVRKYTKISDYAKEVSYARTLAGFHYRFSNEASEEMSRKIADLTVKSKMTPKTP